MLEAVDSLTLLDSLPSPRLLNTHFRFKYLPKGLTEKKSKIVHIVRNPKDACVSYYHHNAKDLFTKIDCPWDEYVEKFMNGQGKLLKKKQKQIVLKIDMPESCEWTLSVYFTKINWSLNENVEKIR